MREYHISNHIQIICLKEYTKIYKLLFRAYCVAGPIYDRQLFERGGAEGLRDEALLQSTLARPLNHVACESTDVLELAAQYAAGIVQNHPFVDGNKRTGFVVGVLFLELNGYCFTASEEAAAQAILALASGTIDERGLCEFLRANLERT